MVESVFGLVVRDAFAFQAARKGSIVSTQIFEPILRSAELDHQLGFLVLPGMIGGFRSLQGFVP